MSYIRPVKNAKLGWKYKPPFHWGQDLLPKKAGSKQDVLAAKDGEALYLVGGTCGGFDWMDDEGIRHRYCHLDVDVRPNQKFKQGEVVGKMAIRGYLKPWWYTHTHWVTWDKSNKTFDPMSLRIKEHIDRKPQAKKLFEKIWKREPAEGDLLTFYYRWVRENRTKDWIINNMKYWYGVVYPEGEYSIKGNRKWQRNKKKIIKKYGG